jgi:hypothetical protein
MRFTGLEWLFIFFVGFAGFGFGGVFIKSGYNPGYKDGYDQGKTEGIREGIEHVEKACVERGLAKWDIWSQKCPHKVLIWASDERFKEIK